MSVQPGAPGTDRFPDANRAKLFDTAGFSIDESIWSLPIEIAFGHHKEDKNFKNRRGTFGQLAAGALEFQFGDKDGECLLQGALVEGVGQRLAANVRVNYTMILDHDTGETLDEIEAKIKAAGHFAILWTTYNHGQTETLIAENELIKFAATKGVSQKDITVTQAIEYLRETKKVVASIFYDGSKLTKELMSGGMKYRVTHAPMARVRSMFPFKAPFDFANRGSSQTQAILEWNERYRGHAEALGLSWDRSCVDPSRLMYLPRVRKGTDLVGGGHEIRVVPGAMLDVNTIPRVAKEKPRVRRTAMDSEGLREKILGEAPPKDGGPTPYKTVGLLAFLRANAGDLEAARFCEDCDPDSVRSQRGGKMEFGCPDEDLHSEQKADDRGFMVANASETEHGTFVMTCQHSGCLERSGGNKGYYLDRICQYYEKTVEDLREYCPHYVQEEEQKAEHKDALDAAIEAITKTAMDHEIQAIIDELAKRPDDVITAGLLDRLYKNSSRKMKVLEAALKTARAKRKQEADDDKPSGHASRPPPGEGATVSVIFQHWDFTARCKFVVDALMRMNETDPTMFSRPEGGVVRLEQIKQGYFTKPMTYDHQWLNALSKVLSFKKLTKDGDQEVAPFDDVIRFIRGEEAGMFPQLDRIVRVPVFARDGALRTQKGYCAELECYLDPRIEFLPVPDVVDDADIGEALYWLFEATRDFSFSDCFDGNDPLPVRDGTVDDDGFPMPNLARGVSSRAHVYAAVLQGFMRNVIDGPTPIYAIDKPVAGEGAGFLVDVISYILEGGRPYVGTLEQNITEFKKETVATLRSSANIAFYDNVDFHIDNPVLASALTAGNFRGRILGLSENADVPIRLLWIIAGKNLSMSAELMRRVVPIKIDSNMEHPERDRPRSYYKHDLHKFIAEKRAQLVWSCHVIGRNWFQRGCPRANVSLESFNEYAAIIGGVLEAAGIEGFLDNREGYLGKKSTDDDSEKNMVRLMYENYKHQEVETRLLLRDLMDKPMDPTLTDLIGDTEKLKDKQISTKFGIYIRKNMSGRTYDLDGKRVKFLIHAERRPARVSLADVSEGVHV